MRSWWVDKTEVAWIEAAYFIELLWILRFEQDGGMKIEYGEIFGKADHVFV